MVSERGSKILEAAIQGFIDTGEPISSGWLFERHDFGIKPAMIRHELELLSDEGYLEQPHHSAGRVPTDQGYEFFANQLVATENGGAAGVERLARFLERREFPKFLEEISDAFGLAGAVRSENNTHKGGMENLIENFEWETAEEIKSVIRDFASIEERLEKVANRFFCDEPKVFVGKKSPITKSECLAVIFGGYDVGRERTSLVAIGPKRMDYKKTIRVFKNLNGTRNKR